MLSVFLLLLFSLASCQDEYQINEEFAPEGVDHDVSSSDKWGYLYPPPSAPSELKLAFNDRMRKGMMGRSWPSILVMGDLDSCSKILIALHGRSFEFSGPIMHIFQHMVMSYNVAVVLPRAPNFDWFVLSDTSRDPEDLKGWKESQEFVSGLIELIQQQFSKPIVVMGFSQSGSLALAASLEQRVPVLAVILCSSYVVRHRLSKKALQTSKIVFFHSRRDHVVPFDWGRQSFEAIRDVGAAGNSKLVVLKASGHSPESDELVAELERLLG